MIRILVTAMILISCIGPVQVFSQEKTSADSLIQDSTAVDSMAVPKYIQRDYNHKQQVIVGSVIMLCITLTLVAMNNYNPRR